MSEQKPVSGLGTAGVGRRASGGRIKLYSTNAELYPSSMQTHAIKLDDFPSATSLLACTRDRSKHDRCVFVFRRNIRMEGMRNTSCASNSLFKLAFAQGRLNLARHSIGWPRPTIDHPFYPFKTEIQAPQRASAPHAAEAGRRPTRPHSPLHRDFVCRRFASGVSFLQRLARLCRKSELAAHDVVLPLHRFFVKPLQLAGSRRFRVTNPHDALALFLVLFGL